MISKNFLLAAVLGMLATIAASTCSANIEANGHAVHSPPDEADHCQASTDAVTWLQVEAHTGSRRTSAAAADGLTAEFDATEEKKGQEDEEAEDDEVLEEREDDDDEEGSHEANDGADVDGCTWTRRRGILRKKNSACERSCQNDETCAGFSKKRQDLLPQALLETDLPTEELEMGSERTMGSRRRRCFLKTGPACVARCKMQEGKGCAIEAGGDPVPSVFSGSTCTPRCLAGGHSPSYDAPTSLTCTNGAFSGPVRYSCLPDAVSGTLTVMVLKATRLTDSDWMSGESDPYVMLTHKSQTERTDTVENSNNPQWNAKFEFKNPNRGTKLTFEVYDNDSAAMDDLLGSGSIDLKEVIDTASTKAYTINLNDVGKLYLKLCYGSNCDTKTSTKTKTK